MVRFPPDPGKRKKVKMNKDYQSAEGQAALWNGRAGQVWVEAQAQLDRLLRPIEMLYAEAAWPPGATVLDVGCGTGTTTLAIARAIGTRGRSVGIDISEPMIAAAQAGAKCEGLAATFIRADAETHGFAPGAFDAIVSRFGIMFFDDPVRAFANLRRAAKPGAVLDAFAWRGPEENPFMTTAERAAAPLLPALPARAPDAPGQFAFADPGRTARILGESGWEDVEIARFDFECALPEDELAGYFTRLGPLGVALSDADEAMRERIVAAVRPAFDRFVDGDAVRFTAACWRIGARSPAARA
jgi:SAM-dependent methyltransferase